MLVAAEPDTPGARWIDSLGRWMVDVPFTYTPPGEDAPDLDTMQEAMKKAAEGARAAAAGMAGVGEHIQRVEDFILTTKTGVAPDAPIELTQTITRRMTVQELADELGVPLRAAQGAVMGWDDMNQHADVDSLMEAGSWGRVQVRRVP